MVVDSLENNGFSISLDDGDYRTFVSTNSGPVGLERSCNVASRLATEGSTVSTTGDTITGQLLLAVNGSSLSSVTPLYMSLAYKLGGPYTLNPYSHLLLDFSAVAGNGSVVVEIGNTEGPGVSDSYWIPFASPGPLYIPFNRIQEDYEQSTDSFRNLSFTFFAESEHFSFTLDEIRAVSEPAVWAMLISGGCIVLWVKRRLL